MSTVRRVVVRVAVVVSLTVSGVVGLPSAVSAAPSALSVTSPTAQPGTFVKVTPTRVLDTRRSGHVAALGSVRIDPAAAGVPAAAAAIVVNVTVVSPSTGGYATVFPTGQPKPRVSNLNFAARQTVPNLVVVGLGTGSASAPGTATIFNGSAGSADYLADVSGYFVGGDAAAVAGGVTLLPAPVRVLDSRVANGHGVSAQGLATIDATRAGVPADAAAVVVNVTAVGPSAGGYASVYPASGSRPTVSNLNFSAGQTVPNLVIVPVVGGKATIYNGSTGAGDFLADVSGYVAAGSPVAAGSFVSLAPDRVLDTRKSAPVPYLGTATIDLARYVPADKVGPASALVANVTVVAPSSGGYATVYAAGTTRPNVSNLNLTAGQTVPNLVISPVTNGQATIYNGAHPANYLADVAGYFRAAAADTTPPGPVTGVVATPNAASAPPSVTLTWTNPTDSDLSGVRICRAVGSTFTGAGTCLTTVAAPGTTYTDTTAAPSTTYTYDLYTLDTSGNQGPDVYGTATTPADTVPPHPVTGLTATPNAASAPPSVTVRWTNPTDTDFAGVKICRGPAGATLTSACTALTTLPKPATSIVNTTVAADTSYTFAVFAFDGVPNYSAATSVQVSTPVDGIPPGPVTGQTATAASNSSITLAWTDPTDSDLAGVKIYRAVGPTAPSSTTGTLVATVAQPGTTTLDTGLNSSTQYSYAFYAYDTSGNLSTVKTATATTKAPPPGPTITGRVTNASGSAVPGVVVTAEIETPDGESGGTSDPTATTAANGTYTLTGLTSHMAYQLCFDARHATGAAVPATGLVSRCGSIYTFDGPEVRTADQALATGAAVTGRVTDTSGHDLADIQVYSYGAYLGVFATTASAGTYTLAGVQAGSDQVCVGSTGATDAYDNPCQQAAATAAVTTADVNFVLQPTGSISGTVKDTGGHALSGVTVSVNGDEFTTNSSGAYTAAGLDPGLYTVCFDGTSATNGTTTGFQASCHVPSNIRIGSGTSVTGINGTLGAGGKITGTVTGAHGGLGGVQVQVDQWSDNPQSATTAANGTYTVGGLLPGVHSVCFFGDQVGYQDACYLNRPSYGSTPTPVTVSLSTPGVANQTLTPSSATPVSTQVGTVTGVVHDAGGHGIENVLVTLSSTTSQFSTFTARTADDGTFVRAAVPVGAYTLCFAADANVRGASSTGYAPQCYDDQPTASSAATLTIAANTTYDLPHTVVLSAGGQITGTVTSGTTPLAGVDVEVSATDASELSAGTDTVTAANGTFSVGNLATGTYTACFRPPTSGTGTGYVEQCYNGHDQTGGSGDTTTPITVTAGSTVQNVNAALTAGGSITGHFRDGTAPVPDVQVTITGPGGQTTDEQTDQTGLYFANGLPAGNYTVCFSSFDQVEDQDVDYGCYNGVAPGGTGTTVTLNASTARTGIDGGTAAVGSISGTVSDSGSHHLGGARITATHSGNSTSVESASDGGYTVAGLVPGAYSVCATGGNGGSSDADGYQSTCKAVTVSAGAASPASFTLSSGGAIAGIVSGKSQGSPVAAVVVTVKNHSEIPQVTTRSDGSYAITGLKTGTYAVCFDVTEAFGGTSTGGYLPDQCTNPVQVTAGSVAAGSITLAAGGSISGVVTDTGSHPLAGVSVAATDSSFDESDGSTDSTGAYTIIGLKAGTYKVCTSADGATGGSSDANGYIDQCSSVTVPTTLAPQSQSFSLAAGAVITGSVVDSGGAPLAGVDVDIEDTDSGGQGYFTQTGSDGTYRQPGLPTGHYTVCFDASSVTGGSASYGYIGQCYDNQPTTSPTPIHLNTGATQTAGATLVAAGELAGTVTDGSHPVADVTVIVDSTSDSDGSNAQYSDTDSTGGWKVDGLASGTYTVCFEAPAAYVSDCYDHTGSPDSTPSGGKPVTVNAGESTPLPYTLLRPNGTMIGQVVDSTTGKGIAGVDVTVTDNATFDEHDSTSKSDGSWKVTALAPGQSYTVCFDGSGVSTAAAPQGYELQCYDDQPDSSTATPVTLPGTDAASITLPPSDLVAN